MSTSVLPWRSKLSPVANYGIAVLSAAAAVAGAVAFDRFLGTGPSISLFLCAIMFVAWASGPGPALLATALTMLAFDWFFLQPIYSLGFQFRDLPRLAVFAIAALFVVALSAAQRRAEDSLRRARDEQRATVRELQRLNESLRESETHLAETQRELQQTIDMIPAVVTCYSPDGERDFVNKPWRDYAGLTLSDIQGEGWRRVIHPDDAAESQRKWRVSLATGEPFEFEHRLRRADGEWRWHMIRRVALRGANGEVVRWYGIGFDIEDQKRAEAAQRQSEAQLAEVQRELQATIDTIPTLVANYGPDGLLRFINKTGLDFSGLSDDDVRNNAWHIAIHPDDFKATQSQWLTCIATGEPFEAELRLRRRDGEYRWVATRRVPLRNKSGKVTKWYSAAFDIEDRKRAELALREREADLAEARHELQLTLDRIPTLAWQTRSDGYAEYLNKRWLDYTGLSIEQALGWEWQVAVHPDDLPGLLVQWRKMLASGNAEEVEARMRRFDGEYRWFLFRPAPLHDEAGNVVRWYGTNTDIEDRKRVESALQRSEAYLAEAQKLSVTGSFGWAIESGDIFWSEETYSIMGFDRTAKPSLDLAMQNTHPDDRILVQNNIERVVQGAQNLDFEHRLLMPDGRVRYVRVRAHRVRYVSGQEEMVGALMDITEARRAQEALDVAQAELAHASRVAALGEISASIAHEVNQPLAAIVANGEACLRFLGREAPDLNDVRGTVEWIVKDGNRAGEVIRRVRALLNKSGTQMVPLDANDVINEVVVLLQRELVAQRVLLRLELAPALPLVFADRIQLQQVIINLVMNGIEAMRSIKGRPRELEIRSHENERHQVVVAVTDTGVGIADESADRLFNAFFSTKPDGLGMGLSICRSIIEAGGGRIWAAGGDGLGATFQFALPSHRGTAP